MIVKLFKLDDGKGVYTDGGDILVDNKLVGMFLTKPSAMEMEEIAEKIEQIIGGTK